MKTDSNFQSDDLSHSDEMLPFYSSPRDSEEIREKMEREYKKATWYHGKGWTVVNSLIAIVIGWTMYDAVKTYAPSTDPGNNSPAAIIEVVDRPRNDSFIPKCTGIPNCNKMADVKLSYQQIQPHDKRDLKSTLPELIITLENGTQIPTGLDDVAAEAIKKGEHLGPDAYAIENNLFNHSKRKSLRGSRYKHQLPNQGCCTGHKTSAGQLLYRQDNILFRKYSLASTYGYGESTQGSGYLNKGQVSKYNNCPVYGAASAELPEGTLVEVINRKNHRSAFFLINDGGPYDCYSRGNGVGVYVPLRPHPSRAIDLNPAGMHELGGEKGLVPVEIRIIQWNYDGRIRANKTWNKIL